LYQTPLYSSTCVVESTLFGIRKAFATIECVEVLGK